MLKLIKKIELEFSEQVHLLERENHILREIFWETTLRCNAKCKHCGSSAGGTNYPDELTTQEIKDFFKQTAKDFNANTIWLDITGGEPLLRQDLFEVMEYVTSLGFRWGMTTNGMLITDDVVSKMEKTHLESISISIDGLEKTHDEFRKVKGSFKKIVEGIKKLQKADFLKVLTVTTVVSKENISELHDIYNFLVDLGIKRWRIMSVDLIGRTTNDMLLDSKETKEVLDFIKENRNKKITIVYGCPSFLGMDYEKEVRDGFFYCRTGINIASILYNGDIFVCPNVPRIPRLIQGNIRDDNFKDIWDNKFEEFRKRDLLKCDMCENCKYYSFCQGGSYHTWDFENNKQNRCVYQMLKENTNEKNN